MYRCRGDLNPKTLTSAVAMVGEASEAMECKQIAGQTAEVMDLQRPLKCSADKMSNMQKQNHRSHASLEAL
jgi:hypothetical protein